MRLIIIYALIFSFITILLFTKNPKISGRVELVKSAVGIKLDNGKVAPVFYQDIGYSPDSFSLNIGNVFFPLTVGPYESFLSLLLQFPFSHSIYLMLAFNIILGIILIILSFYASGNLISPLLVALSLLSVSPLIDRNSYYIGSVSVLVGFMMIWKKENQIFPFILLLTMLINLKLGISLFFVSVLYSLVEREKFWTSSNLYAILGALPSVISYLYSSHIYSNINYVISPPNFTFIKFEKQDIMYYLLILIPVLSYMLKKDMKYMYFLSFIVSLFITELIFYSQDDFKFLPSIVVSAVALGEVFREVKSKLLFIALILAFLPVEIYNFLSKKRNYYPYNFVKELSDYLLDNNVRNPVLLCDVPLFTVSRGELNPIRWTYIWDFVKEKEKYKDKDLRDLQALVLKMQKGRYIAICSDKDDYNEVNMIRIKHHINMRRIKDIPDNNGLFIVARIH